MISIVIPAFNEALNILETLEDIQNVLSKTDYHDNYEIIIVDDHSSDGTYELIRKIQDSRIKGIRLSHRRRSWIAIRAGIHYAKGDAVICISADGQDDPQLIPQMIDKWKKGAKIVWGLRRGRKEESLLVKIPALLFYRILKFITHTDTEDQIDISRATFCLIDRQVVEEVDRCKESSTSFFGLLVWLGYNQEGIEYDRKQRRSGYSKWNLASKMRMAKDWIIAFSDTPLRAMVWIGFSIAALGFLYALLIIFKYLVFGHAVQGWSSLMVVLLVVSGINLSMLGVIGEYLWRTLDETRRRPLYSIEDMFSVDTKPSNRDLKNDH